MWKGMKEECVGDGIMAEVSEMCGGFSSWLLWVVLAETSTRNGLCLQWSVLIDPEVCFHGIVLFYNYWCYCFCYRC